MKPAPAPHPAPKPISLQRHALGHALLSLTPLLALIPLLLLAGCADRTGTAYVELINEQGPAGDKAEPIFIDPRVEILKNEYQRSWVNQGSNIRQRIVIRGPVMIVPLPTTTPSAPPPSH